MPRHGLAACADPREPRGREIDVDDVCAAKPAFRCCSHGRPTRSSCRRWPSTSWPPAPTCRRRPGTRASATPLTSEDPERFNRASSLPLSPPGCGPEFGIGSGRSVPQVAGEALVRVRGAHRIAITDQLDRPPSEFARGRRRRTRSITSTGRGSGPDTASWPTTWSRWPPRPGNPARFKINPVGLRLPRACTHS